MSAECGESKLSTMQQRRQERVTQQVGLATEWLMLPRVAQEADDMWRVLLETHPELTIKEVDENGASVDRSPTLADGLGAMDRVVQFGGVKQSLAEIAIDFCRRAKSGNS